MSDTPIDGKLRQIALVTEATRNTVAPSIVAGTGLKHEGFSFGPKTAEVVDETAKGYISGSNERMVVQKWGEGDIPVNVRLGYLPTIAKMICGQAPTSTSVNGHYEHVYTVKNDNSHATHTLFVYDPNSGMTKFAGGMLNQGTFNLTEAQIFKAVLSMLSQAEQAGAGSITYGTTQEGMFTPLNLGIILGTAFADLATGTIIGCKNANFNINKNCEIDWELHNTNREPSDINNGNIQANGQISFKYLNTTYKTLALGDGYKALEISALDANGFGIKVQFPSVKFSEWTPSTGFGITTETVNFNVDHKDDTNGFLKIVVIDNVATHA